MREDTYRYFHFNVKRFELDQAFRLSVKRNLTMSEIMLKGMEMFLFLANEEWLGSRLVLMNSEGQVLPFSIIHMQHGEEPSIHEVQPMCCSGITLPHKLEFRLPRRIFEKFEESLMSKLVTEKRAISIGITLFVFFDAEEEDGAKLFLKSKNGATMEAFML